LIQNGGEGIKRPISSGSSFWTCGSIAAGDDQNSYSSIKTSSKNEIQ